MLLSAVSFLVVAQSSSEIPEGLMNNPVYFQDCRLEILMVAKQTLRVSQHCRFCTPQFKNNYLCVTYADTLSLVARFHMSWM